MPTVVKLTMSKLSPVFNWMIIVFHTPVVSGFQLMEQAWPSMKTSPGPGLVGSGSACANRAADEAKMVNARATNMFFI